MFGVDSSELLVIVLIAVVVIGPKDLPRVMSSVGKWVGKARGMANQFKSGVNDMVRDSEIAELDKKWREQNEAIMRAHPLGKADGVQADPAQPAGAQGDSGWGLPPPPEAEVAPASPDGAGVSIDKTRPAPIAPSHAVADPVEGLPPAPSDHAPLRPSISVAPSRRAPRAPAAP